jgi:hypothetical protein
MTAYEVLLIGGGAGVGKTTVAWEVSSALQEKSTAHCLIEGDYMDQIHPAPAGDPHRTAITERNVAAVWSNYAALGHHRLLYSNTVSILGRVDDPPGHGRPHKQSHLCPAHS